MYVRCISIYFSTPCDWRLTRSNGVELKKSHDVDVNKIDVAVCSYEIMRHFTLFCFNVRMRKISGGGTVKFSSNYSSLFRVLSVHSVVCLYKAGTRQRRPIE